MWHVNKEMNKEIETAMKIVLCKGNFKISKKIHYKEFVN